MPCSAGHRQRHRSPARRSPAPRQPGLEADHPDPRRPRLPHRPDRLRRRLHDRHGHSVCHDLGRLRTPGLSDRSPDRRRHRCRRLPALRQAPDPVPAGRTARTSALRPVMEAFVSLAHGLSVAILPMNLLFALIGVLLGTAVGVLPGIGPALTVALLLPITFKLDPAGSIIMFAGIYYGGMYGGSTTAILINTPGETVSATFGDSPVRGLTSLFIGLVLGLVGIDKLTGQARLTFGVPELLDGVEVTTLAVGLFAVGEALYVASRRHIQEEVLEPVRGSLWMTKEDWKRSWKPWLRGTLYGFPIGALPAGGAEIPTFLSYST